MHDKNPDLLDRLLEPGSDLGMVTVERAAELSGWSPAELLDAVHGDPPLIRAAFADGQLEINLADLLALATAATRYPRAECLPADEGAANP